MPHTVSINQSRGLERQTRAKTRLVLRDLNAVSVQKYSDPFICKNDVQQNGHHYLPRYHQSDWLNLRDLQPRKNEIAKIVKYE